MTKSILILSPDEDSLSFEGRWEAVYEDYASALKATGALSVEHQSWTEPVTSSPDLVLTLVAWGYHTRPKDFLRALQSLENQGLNVANGVKTLIWNSHKSYLKDLAEAGLSVIPTHFCDRVTKEVLARTREDFRAGDLIVKPVISAGAKDTFVCKQGDTTLPAFVEEIPMMIQPFMTQVIHEGEWSLIILGGQFSHCVIKTPKSGDFRSQPDYGAEVKSVAPPADALLLAHQTIDYIGAEHLLYARVDMVRDESGVFRLMEVELIEPDLYLGYDANACERFAHWVSKAVL